MSDTGRKLEREGYRFDFFQAVRLLEGFYPDRPQVGHMGPAARESVRIRPSTDLSFPAGDIQRIRRSTSPDGLPVWTIEENFLGLYGPSAATPMFIAEMIAQSPYEDDPLRDFLDIFNHRLLSFYYRAWKKYNVCATISGDFDDPVSVVLSALIGNDIRTSDDGWVIPPRRLLAYSGFFSSNSRPAGGLEDLLSDYFELERVRVIPFVPRKYKPPESSLCRISGSGTGGRLGESFVVGQTMTDVAGQFKIRLEDLDKKTFDRFQPGARAYEQLVFLTHLYTKRQLDFSLELVLRPDQGDALKLSSQTPTGALGRSAWLGRPSQKETEVVIEVRDSRPEQDDG